MVKILWQSILVLTLGAVLSGAKPISLETYQQIDHGLSLTQVQANPQLYRGLLLLVGGSVQTTIELDGQDWWQLITPYILDANDRPVLEDSAAQAFWVRVSASADDALLDENRLVTLAGQVLGAGVPAPGLQSGLLLEAREIHAWLSRSEMRRQQPPPPPYWYDPWHDPWCRYPYGFPHRAPYWCW